MCGPTVLWHNTCSTGGITADVVNNNIDIIGCNALVEGIAVRAITCDILITVTNGDALITGSPVDFPRLYLNPQNGHTITFNLGADLVFCGTNAGNQILDLLVTVSGQGSVIFDIQGDRAVSFTCCSPHSGGTKVFIAMDDAPNNPTVLFRRRGGPSAPESMHDVNVEIGCNSCLGFIAEDPVGIGNVETAQLQFEPANTGTGCFFLRLGENSCLIVSGRQVSDLASEILLSDISLNVPAGGTANFIINNPSAGAGVPAPLQVVNNNKLLTNYVSDPFCNGSFLVTGTQYGFIIGPNGTLTTNNITYLDYIGTSTNDCFICIPQIFANLQPDIQEMLEDGDLASVADFLKTRNPSALIIDGLVDSLGQTQAGSQPAQFIMNGSSAIYFTAGTDQFGFTTTSFTIDPLHRTKGFGNIVFDVEAPLEIIGDPDGDNALNVLSLQVTKTGCPIFVESDPANNQFPQRTFARDANDEYLQYNLGAWLINSRINFHDACLLHTDENHHIFERDNLGRPDLASEPTYIGGETWRLCNPVGRPRPAMAFYDSFIRFNTDAGFTGVDLLFPNDVTNTNNLSTIRFYGNGRCIDNAYGRYVILGTNEGGFSCGGFIINFDTHLDVLQEVAQPTPGDQLVTLDVGSNNTCITEGINCDIDDQFSVQSFWLGNNSNISIGTNGDVGTDINGNTFQITTTSTLLIDGDFFSFETHGGSLALPETSGTTGEGGIFVDKGGVFTINPLRRASISAMVTKSHDGVIDLPKRQVFFDHRIGIAHWKVNLNDPNARVLIGPDQNLADFTMDWGDVKKEYCICGGGFVPYEPPNTPFPCECPPVTNDNLQALPVVQGQVEQFQIKRSRIGDQMHLLVDGGFIRETVWLTGFNTAEAPVGFIVVQNDGRVGLGTNHTTIDSLQASIMMGINGVQVCANGTGVVEVNEDITINNVCHILTGTAFGINGPQTLEFHSHDQREIRVKGTGLLDLTGFDNSNKILKFGGQLQLVLEPGARIVFGGGLFVFADQALLSGERVLDTALVAGTDPSDLDPIRVKLIGSGEIRFQNRANWLIPNDTFFGIETDISCTDITDLTVVLNDQAQLLIGDEAENGGVLQVGNTFQSPDASISFNVILNGVETVFGIGEQGFLGFGVGMVNRASPIPNQWTVGCLAGVNNVGINLIQGIFRHNQIVTGDDPRASLFAIGPATSYSFQFAFPIQPLGSTAILGGGNLVMLSNCLDPVLMKQEEPIQQDLVAKAQEFVAKLLTTNQEKMVVSVDQVKPLLMSLLNSFMSARGNNETELLHRGNEMFDELYCKAIKRSKSKMAVADKNEILAKLKKKANKLITRAPIGVTLQPIVRNFAGTVSSTLQVSIMSSKPLLFNKTGTQPVGVTSQALFNYLQTAPYASQATKLANVAPLELDFPRFGYVVGSEIRRQNFARIVSGTSADYVPPFLTFKIGAASINLNVVTNDIVRAIQLQAA
jgi:hypothetical protein